MGVTSTVTNRGNTRHMGGCDAPVTTNLACGCTTGRISRAILSTLTGLTSRTRLVSGFRRLCGNTIVGAKRGHVILRRLTHARLNRSMMISNIGGHRFCITRRGGTTSFTGGIRTNRVAGRGNRGFAAIMRVNVNKDSLNPHTLCVTLRG